MKQQAPETTAKLKRHLESIGVPWEKVYDFSGDIAALGLDRAAEYENKALADGRNPCDCPMVQEWRPVARDIMSHWLVIPFNRVPFTPLDEYGRDKDLRQFLERF